MIRDKTVARRRTPPDSVFLGDLRTFYYWDSYEAPLTRGTTPSAEPISARYCRFIVLA